MFPTASAQEAVFSPPHYDLGQDTDGDGRFNVLHLDVNVTVDLAGEYYIAGELLSLVASNDTFLEFGTQTVRLSYIGWKINASEVDGPYPVELSLWGLDPYYEEWFLLDTNTHTTVAYSHLDFEEPAASFAPPHADLGQDTDGDGRFNLLHVDVNLAVTEPGNYRIEGHLVSSLWLSNSTFLEVGTQTVRLSYIGWQINNSGIDGPYAVELALWVSDVRLDSDTHKTAAYGHFDFEEPPAFFAPPHADFGQDTDGDGRFNLLHVDVNLTVNETGTYGVGGWLHGANAPPDQFRSNYSFLEVGPQTVRLSYDGRQINQSGIDGPYLVELGLWIIDPYHGGYVGVDGDTHTTAAYSHLAFEEPPAFFAPPHADFGQDTDGDGRFNLLHVDVNLTVNETGTYGVTGVIRIESPPLDLYASNSTFLEVGTRTVGLSFDGRQIGASGVDGPYTVDLGLWAGGNNRLGSDTHITAAYSHLDFERQTSFVPPHADMGQDTDGDGRFNYLAVEARVFINDAGLYRLRGDLYTGDLSILIDTDDNVSSLDAGLQTLELRFIGSLLNSSGVDGPYRVVLNLYRQSPFLYLASDAFDTAAYNHTEFEEFPTIVSSLATITPTIDGVYSAGEWADATVVDLTSIPSNAVSALLLVKDDNDSLYLAYDAVGDVTMDAADAASIAFDSLNDGYLTLGHDDQFVQGGQVSNNQSHSVVGEVCYEDGWGGEYCGYDWLIEDSPYDPDLPNHEGLSSAWGFGPSDHSADGHRIYEFKIPLALLRITTEATIGFFGGSQLAPGVVDASAGTSSIWPESFSAPLPLAHYGDLVLGDASPPSVAISSPDDGALLSLDRIEMQWSGSDARSGVGHYALGLDDGSPVILPADATTYTFEGVPDGPHTIAVTAFDLAGNFASDSVSVTVDYTSPVLAITSPAPGTVFGSGDVPVTWVVSDATSGLDRIEVQLDAQAPVVLPSDATTYTFTGVLEGHHLVAVTAYDLAGHPATDGTSFDVDMTSPSLSLLSPAPGLLGSSSIDVSWVAQDSDAGLDRIEVQLDADGPVSLPADATTYTFAGVPDGPHTIVVTAFDLAGNSASDSVTVTVDATPPALVIDAPQDGAILGTDDVEVSWTADDSGSGIEHYEVSLDGAAPVILPPDTTAHTFPGVADGSHTIVVTAFDLAGNPASDSVSVIVDTTAPAVSITSPAPGTFFGDGGVPVTWTAWDAVSGLDRIEVKVDGGTPVVLPADATAYTFTGLSEGSHSIEVTAFDQAGNSQAASVTVAIDATAPTAAIMAPVPGALLATSDVEVRWTASDSGSGIDHFEVILDEAPPIVLAATEASYTFVGVGDGPHTITMRAFDAVGNIAAVVGGFTVDTGPPFVSIASPSDAALVAGSAVALTWTVSDSLSGVDRLLISLDAGAPVLLPADATTYTFTGVADGPHTIALTAFDLAGNSASGSVSVTVDATPPMVSIIAPTDGAILGTHDVQVSWTAVEAGSGIERFVVSLDGGAPLLLPRGMTSHTFAETADGDHRIEVRAIDRAGNLQSVSVRVTVDTTAPMVSITSPATGTFLGGGDVLVAWTASDATSGVDRIEVRLDGGVPVALAGAERTYRFSGLSEGSHTIQVSVSDRAGNSDTRAVSLRVDTRVPSAEIVTPTLGSVLNSGDVLVSWNALDAGSGIARIEVRLDGGPPIVLTGTTREYTFAAVPDGVHTVTVIAIDGAGNFGVATAGFSVDTAVWSPSGPYGAVPLIGTAIGIAVLAIGVAALLQRRRKPRSP